MLASDGQFGQNILPQYSFDVRDTAENIAAEIVGALESQGMI